MTGSLYFLPWIDGGVLTSLVVGVGTHTQAILTHRGLMVRDKIRMHAEIKGVWFAALLEDAQACPDNGGQDAPSV